MMDKIKALEKEAEELKELMQKYPDLKEHRGRWKTFLTSEEVNKNPEGVHVVHSCGCCEDAVMYARFYHKVNDKYIYATKVDVTIGEKVPSYCRYLGDKSYKLYNSWEENVKSVVGEIGIKLINDYFKEDEDERIYDS